MFVEGGIFAKVLLPKFTVIGSFGGKLTLQKDFEASRKSLSSMIQSFSFCYDIKVPATENHLLRMMLDKFGTDESTISPVATDRVGPNTSINPGCFI